MPLLSHLRLSSCHSCSVGCHFFWCLRKPLPLVAPLPSVLASAINGASTFCCAPLVRLVVTMHGNPTLSSRLGPLLPLVAPLSFGWFDDHCVCGGNTGQIIARWRRAVASRVALPAILGDALAPYRLICTAIKMVCKAAASACFSDFVFLSCITVAR